MPTWPEFVRAVHGEAGVAWLERLPALLDGAAERWGVRLHTPFPDLGYHYVIPGELRDGTPVVLKAGVSTADIQREAAALRHYDGYGAARLLDADTDAGVMLLERLLPGTSLKDIMDDARATRIAAAVLRSLWRPPAPGTIGTTTREYTVALERYRNRTARTNGPLPAALVDRAAALRNELLASERDTVLLHGDVHHGNILRAQRRPWLAIDPKGLIGERAYDIGAFLHNPWPGILEHPDLPSVLARRIDILTFELELERERVHAWGLVLAVVAGAWSIEDRTGGWEHPIACAEALVATSTSHSLHRRRTP